MTHVQTLVALVEDLQSPLLDSVRIILKLLVDTFTALEAQIAAFISRSAVPPPTRSCSTAKLPCPMNAGVTLIPH
jgi:hypothetical protein